MIENRSVPSATVIPELLYDDVAKASDWLCRAFGFCGAKILHPPTDQPYSERQYGTLR